MRRIKIIISIIIILLLSTFCLSGCGKKVKTTFDLDKIEDDSQPYWNVFNHEIAKGEHGYYFVSTEYLDEGIYEVIKYMDEATGESTYLCGKPNCNHKNSGCNACFDRTYASNSVYYYKGYIYMIKNQKDDGLVYMVKVKADGSEREQLFDIGVSDINGEASGLCLTFQNDSVYIYYRQGSVSGLEETTATIRMRSLDGKVDENIYEHTGMGSVIHSVKSYGNKIFFVLEEETRLNENSQSVDYDRKGLFMYDSDTKNTINFIDENICDCTVDTENNVLYYYVVKDGLYKMNLSDNKAKKIYEHEKKQTDYCQLSFDGKYLYMSNEIFPVIYLERVNSPMLYVCDTEGKILNQIPTAGAFSLFFGDENYVFSNTEVFATGNYRYIKKSDILTTTEWTNIK